MIYNSLIETIGRTPLLRLNRIEQHFDLHARLLAKLEMFNPGGSVKDRVAAAMIQDAEQRGLLSADSTIIEPTSGNTGIGIAWIARVKGYRTILTMPDTMSTERKQLLQAMGAELVLTPGKLGMQGAVEEAQRLHDTIPHSLILEQFSNPANPEAHLTTAHEIGQDAQQVDALVAGVGTGGTLCGTARILKQYYNPNLLVYAVEPEASPVLRGGKSQPHGLQGIGANFIPTNYDATLINQVLGVSDEQALAMTRLLAQKEGLLAGISSGAALHAAIIVARQMDILSSNKTVVVILPDTGERYLSTALFA